MNYFTLYADNTPLPSLSIPIGQPPFGPHQTTFDLNFLLDEPLGGPFPLAGTIQWPISDPLTNWRDFTLNGISPTAGDDVCTAGCDTLVTPLPAALPLFGSGVIALAGFAWKRKRGEVS